MTVQDVGILLEAFAPLAYTEDFDNTGLLIGDPEATVSGILVTHDTLEAVVDEAIENDCNLIVSFHPIVFKGLKKFTGKNYVERVVQKAIRNDMAIYAIHTALDNSIHGVNDVICDKLGLVDKNILIPKKAVIKKLVTFVPEQDADQVREALFNAGAGNIGNYSKCSFNISGTGSFMGNEDSKPTLGKKGSLHTEKEIRIGVTFESYLQSKILNALFSAHPYEEVAYEITTLDNDHQLIGMGMTGKFPQALTEEALLKKLKQTFGTGCIRHSPLTKKKIEKIAVLGGSGNFAIEAAIGAGADAFVTADLKYHDFYRAEGRLLLIDIGHYESEQYTKELLVDVLTKKITNFAPALPQGRVVLSKINTNPITYY